MHGFCQAFFFFYTSDEPFVKLEFKTTTTKCFVNSK